MPQRIDDRVRAEVLGRDCVDVIAVYIRVMFPVLSPNRALRWSWHHDVICTMLQQWSAALDDVTASMAVTGVGTTDRVQRWSFQGPPGIGKTEPIGRMFPGWRWLRAPEDRGLFGSHSVENQGQPIQVQRRALITSDRYRWVQHHGGQQCPRWHLTKATERLIGNSAGGWWGLTSCKKVGGKGQGSHPLYQIIDDPHQPDDLNSPAAMARIKGILTEMLPGRFVGPRMFLLNMQRLGEGDGYDIMRERYGDMVQVAVPRTYAPHRYALPEADPWYLPEVVDMGRAAPVLADVLSGHPHWRGYAKRLRAAGVRLDSRGHIEWRDPRTGVGELLDDPRYDAAALEADRAAVFVMRTQQEQAGVGRGAGIVTQAWWDSAGLWETLPSRPDEIIITCDPQKGATETRRQPDRTSITVQARWWDHVSVIERVKGVFDSTEAARVLYLLSRRWPGASVHIEDSAAGSGIYDDLRGLVSARLHPARGNTAQRLDTCALTIERGLVHLPAEDARRPPFLPPSEPWPVRVFQDGELPERLRPVEARLQRIATEPLALWVPDFRAEVCGVKPGGSGYDDDADALTIGLLEMRGRMLPRVDAPNPGSNRFKPSRRAARKPLRVR